MLESDFCYRYSTNPPTSVSGLDIRPRYWPIYPGPGLAIMKSAFGSKRKPRKIQVDEEDDEPVKTAPSAKTQTSTRTYSCATQSRLADRTRSADELILVSAEIPLNNERKPFKKSSLRQSIAYDDEEQTNSISQTITAQNSDAGGKGDESESTIFRPSLGRTASKKKKLASSRLSFGPGEIISGDAAEALEDDAAFTPKKGALERRVIESNAIRKSLPAYQLPLRGEGDEERPTYNKDYLNALKSSTPSTPKDLQSLHAASVDGEDGLDETELEGAMIVDMEEAPAHIPSEAEIREKKERRARRAREKDFISLDEGVSDDDQRQISLLPRKKKAEGRLVREDEDLAEGFDEFVDDGRISLGKKTERAARRQQRAAMAELIQDAEGHSSDTDNSEAERHAAYEAAQTRAGMDGLRKPGFDDPAVQVPPKVMALPNLSECLSRLQTTLVGMERDLAKRMVRMTQLQQEKAEILAREVEVQRLLKEAGDKYSAMRAQTGLPGVDAQTLIHPVLMERGLESFGNTPAGPQRLEDVG